MLKKTGTALVAILAIVAVVVVFSGVLERVWIAPQVSPVVQATLSPDKPVNYFPITTLGQIKDKKVQLEMLKVTTGIIDAELNLKAATSQATYDSLIGTINSPGLFGAVLLATATGFVTSAYKNKTMYSENEVTEIKNGNKTT
jgi:hypothetical protein